MQQLRLRLNSVTEKTVLTFYNQVVCSSTCSAQQAPPAVQSREQTRLNLCAQQAPPLGTAGRTLRSAVPPKLKVAIPPT